MYRPSLVGGPGGNGVAVGVGVFVGRGVTLGSGVPVGVSVGSSGDTKACEAGVGVSEGMGVPVGVCTAVCATKGRGVRVGVGVGPGRRGWQAERTAANPAPAATRRKRRLLSREIGLLPGDWLIIILLRCQ